MISRSPIFCSFFTSEYEADACELLRSCRDFGLDADVRAVPNLGSWARNCGYKPQFIRERILDNPARGVAWVDADARVRQYPALFDSLDCDFAAHWRHGVELLSGTLYFGPTARARQLVKAWCEAQQQSPDEWDQRVLQRVIESTRPGDLKVAYLPAEYTRVFDDAKMGEPVVEHMQASRRLAKAV